MNHSIKDFKVTGSLRREKKKLDPLPQPYQKTKQILYILKTINNNKCYKSIEENSIESTKASLTRPTSQKAWGEDWQIGPCPSFIVLAPFPLPGLLVFLLIYKTVFIVNPLILSGAFIEFQCFKYLPVFSSLRRQNTWNRSTGSAVRQNGVLLWVLPLGP